MPHMITLDQAGHIWLTDVGLHQVFKFDAQGKLLLTLGKRLEPGSGSGELFCKPTQVSFDINDLTSTLHFCQCMAGMHILTLSYAYMLDLGD